ncbi:MAG TPA: NusG domain II-containing protein [Candidatus Ozemobacteraceae bacterium]|nr:NusG domain II-containing protein [Candidatus Ozemobacteraceae bacterium]
MMTAEESLARPLRGDLFLVLLLAVVGALLAHWNGANGTNSWQVQIVGRPEKTLVLDGLVAATYDTGGWLGTATIECDGANRWRFVRSPCPNQVCVRSGWFTSPVGVPCVPNGIIVEPRHQPAGVDGVSR